MSRVQKLTKRQEQILYAITSMGTGFDFDSAHRELTERAEGDSKRSILNQLRTDQSHLQREFWGHFWSLSPRKAFAVGDRLRRTGASIKALEQRGEVDNFVLQYCAFPYTVKFSDDRDGFVEEVNEAFLAIGCSAMGKPRDQGPGMIHITRNLTTDLDFRRLGWHVTGEGVEVLRGIHAEYALGSIPDEITENLERVVVSIDSTPQRYQSPHEQEVREVAQGARLGEELDEVLQQDAEKERHIQERLRQRKLTEPERRMLDMFFDEMADNIQEAAVTHGKNSPEVDKVKASYRKTLEGILELLKEKWRNQGRGGPGGWGR